MTLLSSRDIVGLPGVPKSRMGVWKWLKRLEIPLVDCGKRFTFRLPDLPSEIRFAFLAHRAETMGLPMGVQDDAAHLALAAKPVTVQNTAYARAETMMFIAKHEAAGLKWGQIARLLKVEAAKSDTAILAPSYQTKILWGKRIAGVDPVNWAPALAPKYQGRTVTAEISPEAWEQFEFRVYASGKNGTGYL